MTATTSTEREYSNGEMEEFMKETGNMARCMDMGSIFGLMEIVTKVITMKGERMVLVSLLGLTVDTTKASGKMVRSMAKD